MEDEFAALSGTLDMPAVAAAAVVPDDASDLAYATRAIYVGQGGALAVRMVSGDEVTLAEVQPGMIYPLRVTRVLATGTTAGGLVALR